MGTMVPHPSTTQIQIIPSDWLNRAPIITGLRPCRSARTPNKGPNKPDADLTERSQPNPAILNPSPFETWGINGYSIRKPVSITKRIRKMEPIKPRPKPKNLRADSFNDFQK